MTGPTQTKVGSLIRGPSRQLSTSVLLEWDGFIVERHIAAAGERTERRTDHHIIEMSVGRTIGRGERPNIFGHFRPYIKEPGSLSLFSEGLLPGIKPITETELIACALEPRFVNEIAEELNRGPLLHLPTRVGIQDEAVVTLMKRLEEEASNGGLTGRLYSDHLAHALVLRLLTLDGQRLDTRMQHGPNQAGLHRVLERMASEFNKDLNLKTLASETGYSRNHFLRVFRETTGTSPHQHLLHLRIMNAKSMMKQRDRQLIDIAFACGFASPNQFSRAFRKIEGTSARQYRRQIQ